METIQRILKKIGSIYSELNNKCKLKKNRNVLRTLLPLRIHNLLAGQFLYKATLTCILLKEIPTKCCVCLKLKEKRTKQLISGLPKMKSLRNKYHVKKIAVQIKFSFCKKKRQNKVLKICQSIFLKIMKSLLSFITNRCSIPLILTRTSSTIGCARAFQIWIQDILETLGKLIAEKSSRQKLLKQPYHLLELNLG